MYIYIYIILENALTAFGSLQTPSFDRLEPMFTKRKHAGLDVGQRCLANRRVPFASRRVPFASRCFVTV
jgi:hypothetical protein